MSQKHSFSSILEKHRELSAVLEKNYTQQEANEIKQLLASYFAQKLITDMDQLAEEKGWTNETYESWLQEHNRILYKR